MITTLFDDDTDIETEDEEVTFVVAILDSTCRCKQQQHQSDDDMITRRVRAKRSDNEQIKALPPHVIAQQQELTALKQLITYRDDVHTHII